MKFTNIDFGKASEEAEAAETPALVANGYYDMGIVEKLISRKKWLVLGRKGTGKSILGEKLKQQCELVSANSTATVVHLSDFPYQTFSRLIPDSVEASTRYPATWSWLLCLLILDNLSKHPGADAIINEKENNIITQLENAGLLPTSDLQRLVVASSKKNFKDKIPNLLKSFTNIQTEKLQKDISFLNLVEALKGLIKHYSFIGDQFLVVDGLDDILINHKVQYESLTALIFEAQRLNSFFRINSLPISIIILCRTDLYEVLPGPNKNKTRQDWAVELDWYKSDRLTERPALIQLANLRANLSLGESVDIFERFFPNKIEGQEVVKYLTDLTRHTPRDFLMLLAHIQDCCDGPEVTKAAILAGSKTYSEQYFLPEIKDELVGYVKPGDFESFLNCLGEIHERRITTARVTAVAKDFGIPKIRLEIMLHTLFAASAIGMTWNSEGRQERFEFKFRNPHAVFNPRRTILLHKGMWRVLNLS
jgi:hypothetical protein